MNKDFRVDELLEFNKVQYKIFGERIVCKGFSSFHDQLPKTCTFIDEMNSDSAVLLENSAASVFIVSALPPTIDEFKTFILVDNPRKVFFQLVKCIYREEVRQETFIHPTAIVSQRAKFGKNVFIGEYCVIGDCEIGDFSSVRSFSKVHDGSLIGREVQIHEYCNIGGEGFGHVWEDGGYVNQPHVGFVIIEDFVEIFPYTNIDRGTLGATRVGSGVKIDHFCHIGHNSSIGENNLVMCNSTLLGGVKLGMNNVVGAGVMFRDGTKVGSKNFFGMRSAVLKRVDDDEVWFGSPAKQQKKNF